VRRQRHSGPIPAGYSTMNSGSARSVPAMSGRLIARGKSVCAMAGVERVL
jgi:hypothetical protein